MRNDLTMIGGRLTSSVVTGVLGAALILGGLAGCGGDRSGEDGSGQEPATASPTQTPSQPTTTPSPDPSPAPAPPDVELFEFTISDGVAEPPVERVTLELGSTIRIVVTSDAAGDVHVHGYDHAVDMEPGQPATLEFVADQAGLFEVETHPDHLVLLQLVIR